MCEWKCLYRIVFRRDDVWLYVNLVILVWRYWYWYLVVMFLVGLLMKVFFLGCWMFCLMLVWIVLILLMFICVGFLGIRVVSWKFLLVSGWNVLVNVIVWWLLVRLGWIWVMVIKVFLLFILSRFWSVCYDVCRLIIWIFISCILMIFILIWRKFFLFMVNWLRKVRYGLLVFLIMMFGVFLKCVRLVFGLICWVIRVCNLNIICMIVLIMRLIWSWWWKNLVLGWLVIICWLVVFLVVSIVIRLILLGEFGERRWRVILMSVVWLFLWCLMKWLSSIMLIWFRLFWFGLLFVWWWLCWLLVLLVWNSLMIWLLLFIWSLMNRWFIVWIVLVFIDWFVVEGGFVLLSGVDNCIVVICFVLMGKF